jgi:hypothetical protein
MKKHEVALWAGIAAFFGSLLTIGVVDIINPHQFLKYLGSFIIAFITAGAVYAKQRYDDAKTEAEAGKETKP